MYTAAYTHTPTRLLLTNPSLTPDRNTRKSTWPSDRRQWINDRSVTSRPCASFPQLCFHGGKCHALLFTRQPDCHEVRQNPTAVTPRREACDPSISSAILPLQIAACLLLHALHSFGARVRRADRTGLSVSSQLPRASLQRPRFAYAMPCHAVLCYASTRGN